jgi:hypothetical protein
MLALYPRDIGRKLGTSTTRASKIRSRCASDSRAMQGESARYDRLFVRKEISNGDEGKGHCLDLQLGAPGIAVARSKLRGPRP